MKKYYFISIIVFLIVIAFTTCINAQNLYFPPINDDSWERLYMNDLGWDSSKTDQLFQKLDNDNTKALLILKDGKLVIEKYFGDFNKDSLWYWASAGKTVTSFLIGIAKQQNLLKLSDRTNKYLSAGWTSLPIDKENLITIKHQLSMTTGLDDSVEDPYCTNPECLTYKADAGERWAYHNAPYTLLDGVIEGASGKSINQYYFNELRNKIGMNGFFIKSGFNNVLYTNARSMARFGLLILNIGNWDTIQILSDSAYYREMINTSQNINLSYGYLWWLNGKESFMIPQSQFVFNSVLNPSAPADMFCALGKNGQILNIVPSKNLIVVRMGNAPDNSLVPFLLNEEMWQLINPIIEPTSLIKDQSNGINFSLSQNYPNPFNPLTTINFSIPKYSKVTLKVYDVLGKEVSTLLNEELNPGIYNKNWDASNLSSGIYFYRLQSGDYIETKKLCLIK